MLPFYIAGPTGSGKSAVAVELALLCNGEIVNCDAFQLYKGMEILTAKPSAADCARVPHHLYGIIDSSSDFDAASYASLANACINEIASRGSLPIVVGGSGLYMKALTHGMSPLPSGDAELRTRLSEMGLAEKVTWLSRLDPVGAATIDLQNSRYVERALEISILCGKPASQLKTDWALQEPVFRGVVLHWERDALVDRIGARTLAMAERGLVPEVAALQELSKTAVKAIGIREIRAYLAGETTLEAALEAMQVSTRRYAKRQRTWFRREKGFQSVCLSPGEDAKSTADTIISLFPDLPANDSRPPHSH
ncbi:MAG: tRNA (adenosine(37)-N6)-dimethylallyltransferase MiaA [Verrucomicrobiae bacterium]|nr:tRNA (adenosine(37)-N6)-dimethylallyltransferase MiaA [Verrucomicrobiae bacterium]